MPKIEKIICPKDRKEWREWLKKNHNTEKSIFLVHYKRHTGKHFLSHRETLEEAICFGWIDTTIKRIDENTFARCFVRRNENGRWSDATLSYARQMIKAKKMAPAGLKAYQIGLKKPSLDYGREKNPAPPQDLLEAVQKNPK